MFMFLLRSVFWASLIVLVLPVDKSAVDTTVTQSVSTGKAIELVSGAASDLAGFCERNEEMCKQGREFATAFGAKTVYASGLLYHFLNETFANEQNAADAAQQVDRS